MEEKRQGEYFPVYEDDRGTYVLSSRDLCMIEHLALLSDAGIESFKIEGRMKGINYAAGVVKVYREAVDTIGGQPDSMTKARWMRELSMFSSRGYTTGMFFGPQPDGDYNFDEESYRMSHELVGVVLEVDGDDAMIGLKNRLDTGDPVEYLSPGLEEKYFAVECMRDGEKTEITKARNDDIDFARVPKGVRKNDLVRRPVDFRSLRGTEESRDRKKGVHVTEGCG
jgi:putative protease